MPRLSSKEPPGMKLTSRGRAAAIVAAALVVILLAVLILSLIHI